MNILAPLRHSEEVQTLLRAGADEFFCGITPPGWEQEFGRSWVSRRPPRTAGGPDVDDLGRIIALAGDTPVYVTLNAPCYPPGAVEALVDFASILIEKEGVAGLIVADLDLLLALSEKGYGEKIHVSSLATCLNAGSARFYRELGVSRVILPRHLTLAEIEAIRVPKLEFEVFLLNDGCVFEEGLCATTHAAGTFCLGDGEGTEGISPETLERYGFWRWTLNNCGCRVNKGYPLGPCGLCALPRLLKAGVSSFKVVGREAGIRRKEASVMLAAQAMKLALAEAGPEEIRQAVIALRGMPQLCHETHLCYYPDLWRESHERKAAC